MEALTSGDFEIKQRTPKILLFDIETAPLKMAAWKWWETTGIWLDADWYMLGWSCKELNGKQTTRILPDYDGYVAGSEDDSKLVAELWQMLGNADIVIGHNIDRFDIRKTRTRAMLNGEKPLAKFQTVDTLKIAKREFAFTQNSLDALAEYLKVPLRKLETGGKKLWRDCMAGDMAAWRKMKRYNRQDVLVNEAVYKELRGWTQTHPHVGILSEVENGCRNCGSTHLQKRGVSVTQTGKRPRWHCQICGTWMTGKHKKETDIK